MYYFQFANSAASVLAYEDRFSETSIRENNPFYHRGYEEFEPQYYTTDGYKVSFTIPFDGDSILLYLKPPTYYLSRFYVDNVIPSTESEYGKIIISLDYKGSQLKGKENINELIRCDFEQKFKT